MSTFPHTTTDRKVSHQQHEPHNAAAPDFRPPTPPPPSYSPITPELSLAVPAGPASENPTMMTTATYDFGFDGSSQQQRKPQPNQHSAPSRRAQPSLQNQSPQLHAPPQPGHHHHPPTTQAPPAPRPPPLIPLDPATNPDAIALRAAMSILQLQRQQALSDMQALERQKGLALQDPEGFARATAEGRVKSRSTDGGAGGVLLPAMDPEEEGAAGDKNEDEDTAEDEIPAGLQQAAANDVTMTDHSHPSSTAPQQQPGPSPGPGPAFPNLTLPGPQNVVRMPHINWTQYHVVGESLDRLHEEQRLRPTAGLPEGISPEEAAEMRRRGIAGQSESGRKEAVLAAPYDPFVDVIDDGKDRDKPAKDTGGSSGQGKGVKNGAAGAGAGTGTESAAPKRKSGGKKG